MSIKAEVEQWRGWKYYCRHEKPKTAFQALSHAAKCGRTPITELEHHEDCVEGCGCIWDTSSPAYWKNHIHMENQS